MDEKKTAATEVELDVVELSARASALEAQLAAAQDELARAEAFWTLDVDAVCAFRLDGTIERANAGLAHTLRLPPNALVGTSLFDRVHESDRDMISAVIDEFGFASYPAAPVYFECRLRRQGGRYRWIGWRAIFDVSTRTVVATGRDVTDTKHTQRVLAQSEQSFRSLVERLPTGILVTRRGVVVYANPVLAQALGYDDSRALAGLQVPHDLFHAEDFHLAERLVASPEALAEHAASIQVRCLHKSGQVRQMTGASAILRFDGMPTTVAMLYDVSDAVELQEQLRQADRLASLGTLAAGVAHEVNNPLSYVIGNLDLALDELEEAEELPAELAEALVPVLTDALDGAERVRRIVQELRTFTRPDPGAPDDTEVSYAVQAALRLTGAQIRARARLDVDLADNARVKIDESRLVQVLVNLLVNAAQAVRTESPSTQRVGVRTWTSGGLVHISISDTGPGIPPEIKDRIFEPFFTTKPAGEGTGLGLAICRKLVDELGGTLDVKSDDEGTTFTLSLPHTEAPAEEISLSPRSLTSRPAVSERRRVLVIDDDVKVAQSVARMLSKHIDATIMSDPVAALKHLSGGAVYDAVVCDVMMPDLTGIELYRQLDQAGAEVCGAFVFVSGGVSQGADAEFLTDMADRFVRKPLDGGRLLTVIDAVATQAAAQSG